MQQSISYIYDDAGVGSDEGFTINNALGRLTRVTFDGGYYLYSYNSEGNIERMYNQLSGMFGKTILYEYNRLGEPIPVQYQPGASDSHYLWYTYDQPGRLELVRSNTTTSQVTDADYSYWPSGVIQNENLQSYNNTFLYDARDRVIQINSPANDLAPFSASYTYHHNSTIDFAQFRQPATPHSHVRPRYRHTYNARNQIKSATYNWWNGSSWQNPTSYDVSGISYDRDGNLGALTRRTDTGSANTYSYTYSYASGSNRLTAVNKDGTNITFGYDRNGNVTMIGGNYVITATSYDWRNLPLSITKSSFTTYSNKYDHLGNRTYKSSGNTRYVRGAFGEVLAVYDGFILQYHNILRPDGVVIGRREGSDRFYYHRDHLGSTRAVINSSGTVVETQDYYPFGLQMPGRIMTTGNSAKEKFTSHELDDEVDLYYMIARRYAPEFGRFLSVDPMADEFPSWSPYTYTLNNPVNLFDPDGQAPMDDVFVDSESGEVNIIETEEADQLFVDGEALGVTDVDFFREGANTFDSFTDLFTQKLGGSLLNNDLFSSLMNSASREDIKVGLLGARVNAGTKQFFSNSGLLGLKTGQATAGAISDVSLGLATVAAFVPGGQGVAGISLGVSRMAGTVSAGLTFTEGLLTNNKQKVFQSVVEFGTSKGVGNLNNALTRLPGGGLSNQNLNILRNSNFIKGRILTGTSGAILSDN